MLSYMEQGDITMKKPLFLLFGLLMLAFTQAHAESFTQVGDKYDATANDSD